MNIKSLNGVSPYNGGQDCDNDKNPRVKKNENIAKSIGIPREEFVVVDVNDAVFREHRDSCCKKMFYCLSNNTLELSELEGELFVGCHGIKENGLVKDIFKSFVSESCKDKSECSIKEQQKMMNVIIVNYLALLKKNDYSNKEAHRWFYNEMKEGLKDKCLESLAKVDTDVVSGEGTPRFEEFNKNMKDYDLSKPGSIEAVKKQYINDANRGTVEVKFFKDGTPFKGRNPELLKAKLSLSPKDKVEEVNKEELVVLSKEEKYFSSIDDFCDLFFDSKQSPEKHEKLKFTLAQLSSQTPFSAHATIYNNYMCSFFDESLCVKFSNKNSQKNKYSVQFDKTEEGDISYNVSAYFDSFIVIYDHGEVEGKYPTEIEGRFNIDPETLKKEMTFLKLSVNGGNRNSPKTFVQWRVEEIEGAPKS